MMKVLNSCWLGIPSLLLIQITLLFDLAHSCASLATTGTPPIIVAGAGPASLVFCQKLLSSNPEAVIHIYEKRSRPPRYSGDEKEVSNDVAFGFGLTTRGLLALEKVGWKDKILSISRRSLTGTYMTNRRDMVAEMIHELESQFSPNRLQFRFECKVTKLHQNGTVNTQDCQNDIIQNMDYSLCVAADGSNSCIRKNLLEMGRIKVTRFANSLSWKALQLPPQPNMQPGGFASYQSEGGKELCFVTPRYKDRFVMMYYRFNRKDPRAQANPMNVNDTENLMSAVTNMFPNITSFPSETAMESFLEKLPGQEVYMTLNKHAIPDLKVALIGDAAVGTYVLFGHGCVSAMERATLLAESCTTNANLEEALETFSAKSVREGRAISDLNLISHLLRSKLFRQKALETRGQIQNLLVNEPGTSYHEILQVPRIKRAIRLSKLFWRFGGRRKAPP